MKKHDHEALRMKKQKNVAEQNATLKDTISQCAQEFRERRYLPETLISYFEEHGLDTYQSLLVRCNRIPCGGGNESYTGEWITQDAKFYFYDITLDRRDYKIIEVCQWADKTESIELNSRKPGVGKTRGYLCVELLNELKE